MSRSVLLGAKAQGSGDADPLIGSKGTGDTAPRTGSRGGPVAPALSAQGMTWSALSGEEAQGSDDTASLIGSSQGAGDTTPPTDSDEHEVSEQGSEGRPARCGWLRADLGWLRASLRPAAPTKGKDEFLHVKLTKSSGEGLGIDLVQHGGNRLEVAGLGESGAVVTWNTTNPEKAVRTGDLIVAVNGVEDELDRMRGELERGTIELVLQARGFAVGDSVMTKHGKAKITDWDDEDQEWQVHHVDYKDTAYVNRYLSKLPGGDMKRVAEAPSSTTTVWAVVALAGSAVAAALALAWWHWDATRVLASSSRRTLEPFWVNAARAAGGLLTLVVLACIGPYCDGQTPIATFTQALGKTSILIVEVLLTCGLYYLDLYTDTGVLRGFWHAGKPWYFSYNLIGILAAAIYSSILVWRALVGIDPEITLGVRLTGRAFQFVMAAAALLQLLPLGCAMVALVPFVFTPSKAEFRRFLVQSKVLFLLACGSLSESLIEALLGGMVQVYTYLADEWDDAQKHALRVSIAIGVLSLTKGFAELDKKGKPVRILHGGAWVQGSAPLTHPSFLAVGVYRAVAICGRVLLPCFLQILTRGKHVLEFQGIAFGGALMMFVDFVAQASLILQATNNPEKVLWAFANVISFAEPVLHGGGPILSTRPEVAAGVHLLEALAAAAIVVWTHGGLDGTLADISAELGASDQALLCVCVVCSAIQLPLLLAVRRLCAYAAPPREETWEAYADATMDSADRRAPVVFWASSLGSFDQAEVNMIGISKSGHPSGDGLAKGVAILLEANSVVTAVNLSFNQIGNAGARALAALLERNTTLQWVDLQLNQIGSEGAVALAAALERNSTLQEVWLQDNQIASEGAAALAVALERNSTLQKVWLRDNHIGSEGAVALAAAVERSSTVQRVALQGNQIGQEGERAVRAANERRGREVIWV